MDDRHFAEHSLGGSLFSLLWTIAVTGAWVAYDHRIGTGVRGRLTNWLDSQAPARPEVGAVRRGMARPRDAA